MRKRRFYRVKTLMILLMEICLITFLGCGTENDSSVATTTDATLTLSPNSQTISVSSYLQFTATGGSTPYNFSVLSGGGTINSSTGEYWAPSTAGTVQVQVKDATGTTDTSTLTISTSSTSLTISPTALTISIGATIQFSASGGSSPYAYSILSGGGTIDSSSGYFTAPSVASVVTVNVTDSSGVTATASVTVSSTGSLTISPSSQSVSASSTLYLYASGGTPSYTFSIFSGGGSIDASSGYFTAPSTASVVLVRVMDAAGMSAYASITVTASSSSSYTIRCSSVHFQYSECTTPTTIQSVTVQHKYSKSSCTYGSSWGYFAQSVWVNNGCDADFQVTP